MLLTAITGIETKAKLTKKIKSTNLLSLYLWVVVASVVSLYHAVYGFIWLQFSLHRRSRRSSRQQAPTHSYIQSTIIKWNEKKIMLYIKILQTTQKFDRQWLWETVHWYSICILTSPDGRGWWFSILFCHRVVLCLLGILWKYNYNV